MFLYAEGEVFYVLWGTQNESKVRIDPSQQDFYITSNNNLKIARNSLEKNLIIT